MRLLVVPRRDDRRLRLAPALQPLAAAEKVRAHMKGSKLFIDVDSTYRPGKPQVSVEIDRDRAAALGLPAAAIGRSVRAFLGRDEIARFREQTDRYDIRLELPRDDRSPERLGELTLRAPGGQLVELRNGAAAPRRAPRPPAPPPRRCSRRTAWRPWTRGSSGR